MFCIIYKSYGEWRITMPFKTRYEALKHQNMYITTPDKDYNTDVQIIYIKEMDQ